jgi:hypothetical protein
MKGVFIALIAFGAYFQGLTQKNVDYTVDANASKVRIQGIETCNAPSMEKSGVYRIEEGILYNYQMNGRLSALDVTLHMVEVKALNLKKTTIIELTGLQGEIYAYGLKIETKGYKKVILSKLWNIIVNGFEEYTWHTMILCDSRAIANQVLGALQAASKSK